MIKEKELYPQILELFDEDYFSAENIPLGPKVIDLALISKSSGKVIAIEAKVKDWKRALRQALNYQLAADESYVAISRKHSNAIDHDRFKKLGVGLIVVDLDARKADIMVPAKQSSKKAKNYATLMRAHLAERRATSINTPQANSPNESVMKHFLWYVAIERRYYDEFPDCYDGFVINAHVLAHYASAFSALCMKLNKPFFIIPDTHAFQLASPTYFLDTKGGIRSSWEKLINSYGALVKLAVYRGRRLTPVDFMSSSGAWQQSLYDLIKNALNFQKQRVPSAASGLSRFIEGAEVAKPANLVAPYFFFTSVRDPWYKISVKMAKESTQYKQSHNLFALLCTSKDVIVNDQEILTIARDYSGIDVDGFLVWVQDFEESTETVPLLLGLRKLVDALKKNKRTVINLHGEFFSSLLCYYGLDGVCYGICYKGSSDPEEFPTATGGPPGGRVPKYYFKELKTKMGKVEAALAVKAEPSLKCSCPICAKQLDFMLDAATPDIESRDLMKRHFLISKKEEKNSIGKKPFEKVIQELHGSSKKYEKKAEIISVEHLKRWTAACKTNL
jgi:hypothetical protein